MPVLKFFPTQVWQDKMPQAQAKALIQKLIREAYLFREEDFVGKKWSKENYDAGYTSYSSVADLYFRSSNFAILKQWIDKKVQSFAKVLEMDLCGGRLEMGACWVNIMGQHCHHSFHIHPLSAISGTFYLQVPKGSGSFKLEDPRLDAFMASPPRKQNAKIQNQQHIKLQPSPGSLILFESWLRHEVPANLSKQDRISVSFNYDWIQKVKK